MQFSSGTQLLRAEGKQKSVVLKKLADDPKSGQILKQAQSLLWIKLPCQYSLMHVDSDRGIDASQCLPNATSLKLVCRKCTKLIEIFLFIIILNTKLWELLSVAQLLLVC